MKSVLFSLSQTNGNNVSFEMQANEALAAMSQDVFAGTYLFPATLRLICGAAKLFNKALPVHLSFSATYANGDTSNKVVAKLRIKSKSVSNVRRTVMLFNEALAALVAPEVHTSVYDIASMKAGKTREFQAYAGKMLRPSVKLSQALEVAGSAN